MVAVGALVVALAACRDGAAADAGPADGLADAVPADGLAGDTGHDAWTPLTGVTIDNYPRVDGSTSTLPLARVIACELLGLGYTWQAGRGSEGEAEIVPVATTTADEALATKVMERIVHNRTHAAYTNLVDGVADMIMVANPPSPDERTYAEQHGVTLVWRPLALDALVVITNAAVDVDGLSTDQIQRIFAGEITDWSEVGGEPGEIHPYVRPENSGSQQLMNSIVMQGHQMADWPDDRRPAFMGALVDQIRSDSRAIGYSVFYWVTYQYPSSGYRILAVDSVRPTPATIGARTYPFAAEVLVVTRADLDPRSLAGQLRDWLLSPPGQVVVGRSGYVPVAGAP